MSSAVDPEFAVIALTRRLWPAAIVIGIALLGSALVIAEWMVPTG